MPIEEITSLNSGKIFSSGELLTTNFKLDQLLTSIIFAGCDFKVNSQLVFRYKSIESNDLEFTGFRDLQYL